MNASLRLAAAALAASATLAAAAERISLTVGHNAGLAGEPRLFYAAEDARRVHSVLAELGGVAPDRGYLLLNRSPAELEKTLTEIEGRAKEIKHAGKDVELLVFYSGHASAEALHLGGQKWPMERLRAFLGRVEADLKVTILDACNSGAFITRKGGTLTEPVRFREEDELKARGSVVLTSSSALEFSHESKALRGSLFSHYLLSGLRGAADYNRDRAVSLWEAYHYARMHTSRHLAGAEGRTQSPGFDFRVAGEKDLVLTALARGRSRIRFENCPPGAYALYNQALSEQWAEVDLRANDTVEIQLPAMEFVVHRLEEDALHVATADLRARPEWVLRPASFRRTRLRDYQAKGENGFPRALDLELRLRVLRQVPEQEAFMTHRVFGALLPLGRHRFGAHLGYLSSETRLAQDIARRGLSLGASWGLESPDLRRIGSINEIRYTAFLWGETVRSGSDGYVVAARTARAAAPDHYSLVHSLGADWGLRWRPGARWHLDLRAGTEFFGYSDRDGLFGAKVEWPVSVGLGYSL